MILTYICCQDHNPEQHSKSFSHQLFIKKLLIKNVSDFSLRV